MYCSGGTISMETVPAKLTHQLIAEMDEVIREGWYANRSELIRDAVRETLRRARAQRIEAALRQDVDWGLRGKD